MRRAATGFSTTVIGITATRGMAVFYFGVGMCRYANLGILDCSLSLAIDGHQFAFHGSRRAPSEPTDTSVGPFELQILEPMGAAQGSDRTQRNWHRVRHRLYSAYGVH